MSESLGRWPKHFLYLSPTKIDALFYQMDQGLLRSITKKLTIDLKIVKAELSSGERNETLYARLKVALSYLERQSLIGSIDQPGRYFAGSLLMAWGPYIPLRLGSESDPIDTESKLVYFGGRTDETILGLGGSMENVFGNVGASPTSSLSSTPGILRILAKDLHQPTLSKDNYPQDFKPDEDRQALTAVELATRTQPGPWQEVEFVAKRLLWGESAIDSGGPSRRVLLGSPIYVALDD
jgi:hypothetical protein